MTKLEKLNNVENLMVEYEKLTTQSAELSEKIALVEDRINEVESSLFKLTNDDNHLRKAVNTFIEKVGSKGIWEE